MVGLGLGAAARLRRLRGGSPPSVGCSLPCCWSSALVESSSAVRRPRLVGLAFGCSSPGTLDVLEPGIEVKAEGKGEGEVRAESDGEVVVMAVAAALLRLVPRFFWPTGPVASVLALALTLDADLALAFAILALVAVMAVRETPDGGGDPIVAVVEKVLPSDVVEANVDPTRTLRSPPVSVSVMSLLVVVAAAVAALWTAERASENADCSVATVQSAFSDVGPPMCAIAWHLRRGGGRGLEVVEDPMVAMVEVLLRPVRAGTDDGGLAASARGEWECGVVVGVEGGSPSELRRVGTS